MPHSTAQSAILLILNQEMQVLHSVVMKPTIFPVFSSQKPSSRVILPLNSFALAVKVVYVIKYSTKDIEGNQSTAQSHII
jgi:hypothetical protein